MSPISDEWPSHTLIKENTSKCGYFNIKSQILYLKDKVSITHQPIQNVAQIDAFDIIRDIYIRGT